MSKTRKSPPKSAPTRKYSPEGTTALLKQAASTKPLKVANPHCGSNLDDFLREDGVLEEVETAALKRAFALAVADEMRGQEISKAALARPMSTSRAALDRLLDPENTSATLQTLTRAAKAVGCRLVLQLAAPA